MRRLGEKALCARRSRRRLSLVFVDDRTLRRLHRDFCNDDTVTDVITFDLGDGEAELAISAERAKKEAKRRGVEPFHELALYIVHGILHLEGFRDETAAQRKRMRAEEEKLLATLGLPHVF